MLDVYRIQLKLTLAVHIHLRAETKTAEHRSALTPTTTAALLKAGNSHQAKAKEVQASKSPLNAVTKESLTTLNSERMSSFYIC